MVLPPEDFRITGAPEWAYGTTRTLPGQSHKSLVYKSSYPDSINRTDDQSIHEFENWVHRQFETLRDAIWEDWLLSLQSGSLFYHHIYGPDFNPYTYKPIPGYTIREILGMPVTAADGSIMETALPITAYELLARPPRPKFAFTPEANNITAWISDIASRAPSEHLPFLLQHTLHLAALGRTCIVSQYLNLGMEEAFNHWHAIFTDETHPPPLITRPHYRNHCKRTIQPE